MRVLLGLPLLLLSMTAAAEPADIWLDRAAKEIRALRQAPADGGEKRAAFLQDEALAGYLVKLGGRAEDRELLRQIGDDVAKQFDVEPDRSRKLALGWSAAEATYLAGDAEAARRMLSKAEPFLKDSDLDKTLGGFSAGLAERSHLVSRARFGDLSKQEISELSLERLSFICRILEATGEREQLAPFLKAGRVAADALQEPSASDYLLVGTLFLSSGEAREAIRRAENAPAKIRVDALTSLLRPLMDRDSLELASEVAAKAWRAIDDSPATYRDMQRSSVLDWMAQCKADRDMLLTATKTVEEPLVPLQGEALLQERYATESVVKAAHALGQPDRRDYWLRRLEAIVPLNRERDRRERWAELAGFYVDVGKVDDAVRCLGKAKRLKGDENDLIYAVGVSKALAQRGDYEQALKVLTDITPELKHQRFDLMRVANAAIERGDATWVDKIIGMLSEDSDVLRVRRAIVIRRVAAGETNGLAEWIDAIPDARHRAVLNLAVAESLLGRSIEAYMLLLRLPR